MLEKDPLKRISANKALQHSYFQDIKEDDSNLEMEDNN